MPSTLFRLGARARTLALLGATALILFCATPARAGRIDAPLEQLTAPGHFVIAGPLLEINPVGRLVFQRKDVLAGKPRPPERIDVRVAPAVLPGAKVGERYIVGYSMYHRDRRTNALVANLGGPSLLVGLGLEPALFRDTPAVRALLKLGRSESRRASRRFRDLLLQALAGDDPQLQNLAAGEIALDPDVRARVRAPQVLERVARDARTRPSVRALLLQAAVEHPQEIGGWWQAAAIEAVTTTPVDGYADAASDPSGFVLGVLDVLDQGAVKVDAPALSRWLRNPNPALAERVALMLRRESPVLERTAVREALADPALPAQTRHFLDDHLRRLERSESGAKARKDGSG